MRKVFHLLNILLITRKNAFPLMYHYFQLKNPVRCKFHKLEYSPSENLSTSTPSWHCSHHSASWRCRCQSDLRKAPYCMKQYSQLRCGSGGLQTAVQQRRRLGRGGLLYTCCKRKVFSVVDSEVSKLSTFTPKFSLWCDENVSSFAYRKYMMETRAWSSMFTKWYPMGSKPCIA